jgi:hypothetical protein
MGDHVVDDLAKALTDRNISRKRALGLARSGLLAVLIPTLTPRPAEADAKRRCRRKGGVLLSHGTCRCAAKCGITDPHKFYCGGGNSCTCRESVEKTGFCSSITGSYSDAGCHSSAECNEGKRCIMVDFPSTCPAGPACPCDATQACIDGICRHTYCVPPCP